MKVSHNDEVSILRGDDSFFSENSKSIKKDDRVQTIEVSQYLCFLKQVVSSFSFPPAWETGLKTSERNCIDFLLRMD